MTIEEVKAMRMNIGKFLHDYYIKFGEDKYNTFVEKMGKSMLNQYGEPFSSENLRIMEAEYVTLTARINEKTKPKDKKVTT